MSRFDLIRYSIARQVIHAGLTIMPESRFKTELVAQLWTLRARVIATVAVARALEQGR